ncbi:MAG: hypothetical protein ACYDBB_19915 [Armatimonadota bacterium]
MLKLLFLLVLSVLCATVAMGVARKTTITDYLGLNWTNELVHYSLTFAPGELKGAAVIRVETAGKAIPSQVSNVLRYDDGSVKSCTLWLYANVPANQSVTYTFTPGKMGLQRTGVTAKVSGDSIELTTRTPQQIGIRLLNGAKDYQWPIPAAQVPGPLKALLLASGRETGEGRFAVPFNVKSYRAEVTATGPLFAEARVTYTFDTGYWTFTARVLQNSPMVLIKEEFDNGYNNQQWNAVDRFYEITLNGKGFQPTQAFYTGRNEGGEYADLAKSIIQDVMHKVGSSAVASAGTPVSGMKLTFKQDRTDYFLTAWPTWSNRVGVSVRFIEPGKDAVGFVAVKTTDWRNPLSLRFRETVKGELVASLPIQMYEQAWPSEGFGRFSPNATGKTLFVPENTGRRSYGIMLTTPEDETQGKLISLLSQSAKLGCQPLDEVKDWNLAWPDPLAKADWAKETSKGGQQALTAMRDWLAVKRNTGNFGLYSMWNFRTLTHARYQQIKGIIDSPKDLTFADRQVLRRLCAYQAYVENGFDVFPWGHGPHIGNPNMSIMAMDCRVKSALLVKDHPKYNEWGAWTLAFTKNYIERFTRESGAPYEDPHYTLGVTLLEIAEVNRVLLEAGIGDALDTPRFKACMRFLLDWSLPPDPRFLGHRQILEFGNGSSYMSVPPTFAATMVDYYKTRDPKLAAQLQWLANKSLPADKQVKVVTDEAPQLRSINYQDYGVYFRHGYGTPYETMFFMMAGDCEGHYEWETEQMSYTLYAKGQPINLHFGNGYQPMFIRPWLRNRVSIDHMFEETERNATRVTATAFEPAMEYAHATHNTDSIRPLKTEYPVLNTNGTAWSPEESAGSWPPLPVWQRIPMTIWHRQVLFLKDADPKGPNYFVLRDSFAGAPTRPSDLSFWFLANNMTRKGDVFHFDGQCKVDMDVFVATPAAVEPETGKYGHPQWPYGRMVGFDPKFHPGGKLQETQLFLRLKQPVGKGYLVVLYPRLKEGDPEAAYTTLADGAVQVETPASTDYAFVNSTPFAYKNDRVEFQGVAGSVRFYKDGKVVVTNAEGKGSYRVAGKLIAGEGAYTVTVENRKVTVSDGAKVTVQ